MTPNNLRNIHITRNSCRDTLSCTTWPQNYTIKFTCCSRSLLVATSKFGLLTIRQHSATRKHLFLYPHSERLGLTKPKKDKHQHSSVLPPVFICLSQSQLMNNNFIFIFEQLKRKRWSVRLVDVIKHLSYKVFSLWYHY